MHDVIDPRRRPRALVRTALGAPNAVNARIERRRFGSQIEAARVQDPLFIPGRYRGGTTHLHNLLALDPQSAAPTFFRAPNPYTFPSTERWAAPVADRRAFADGGPPARPGSTTARPGERPGVCPRRRRRGRSARGRG